MNILTVNKVNCKDCYRCVRECPMKAIRIAGGHAEVEPERCVLDGRCVAVCPQKAKQIRNDIPVVEALLQSGRPIVASVAPSAPAVFGNELEGILTALRLKGFAAIEETSRTAAAVAELHKQQMQEHPDKTLISSSCPAVVSLICRYYPQHRKRIAKVLSPMAAHAKVIREEYGADTGVVFIGPCIAKKREADECQVDAAITFDELRAWIGETPSITSSKRLFDNKPVGISGLFPLANGLLRTADLPSDGFHSEMVTITGLSAIRDFLDTLPDGPSPFRLIEALACSDGCISGPGAQKGPENWKRRINLLDYQSRVNCSQEGVAQVDSHREDFPETSLKLPIPSESEIRAILRMTGKNQPEDEHNCGACGYDTCRDKAVAVFQGMAEAEMCIPYMRSRAEGLENIIIHNTPNGIVTADFNSRILKTNLAFDRLMGCEDRILVGRPLDSILDDSIYRRVMDTRKPAMRPQVHYNEKELREMVLPVEDHDLIIGIYIDITSEEENRQKMSVARNETLTQASKVIENQMRVAQEIASLLGETTADTKVLLTRLINLYKDGGDH